MKFLKWAATLLLAGTFFTLDGANLVVNNDFAQLDSKNFPASWSIISRGGAKSSRTAGPDGREIPVLEFDLQNLPQVTRIEQALTLVPGRQYKVSFYCKYQDLSGAGVYLTTLRWSGGSSRMLKGTSDWKKYEFTATFPGPDSRHRLILFAGKNTTGKLYFADVQVEEIITVADGNNAFISIPRLTQAPEIDGVLDNDVWQDQIGYTPFVEGGSYQYTRFAKDNTVLYLGYDEKYLYAAFKCYQECLDPVRNQLDAFKNSVTLRDGAVVKDDCVRLFISRSDSTAPVYEFTVNSLGTLKDAVCTGEDIWSGRDKSFNSSTRCAGKVYDGFYIVEMAVPLSETIQTLQIGTEINIMAGRVNHSRQSSSVYFPRKELFHKRSALGRAVIADTLPSITDLSLNLDKASNRQLSFFSNGSGAVILNAVGENKQDSQLEFNFNAAANSFAYTLPGQEYNSAFFTFSSNGKVFWQTPVYVIGNALTNTVLWSGESSRLFSAEQGIYPAPAAVNKLQKNGFDGIFELAAVPEYLAVNQTLFWPEDNNNFHIAAGSLQQLHIVATTSEKQLADKSYQLCIAMPEDFTLEAVSTPQKTFQLSSETLESKVIAGKRYNCYVIKNASNQAYKLQPGNYDLLTLLIRSAENARADEKSPIYVFAIWDDGKIVEVPQTLNINVYPALDGPQPKLFRCEMWGGSMVNLIDREANMRFLIDTVKASGMTQLQNFPIPGMKRMGVMAYSRLLLPKARHLIAAHPEFRKVNSSGEVLPLNADNFLCSRAIAYAPEIAEIVRHEIAVQLKDYDVLCSDYESPAKDGFLSCYCDLCLKDFADFAQLSEVPPRQDIHTQYSTQWRDFMTTRLAECCKMWRDAVHANNKEFYFYSGYQSEKSLNYYSVDWNKLNGILDLAGAGYTRTRKEIEATTQALGNGNVPLLSGVIAEPWHVYLRQKSLQISMAYLAVGLTAGSKGFLVYNLPGCDGRSFYNFSRFTKFLSEYEEVLFYGKRLDSDLTLRGIAPECGTVFSLPGQKRVAICYNSTDQAATVRISLPFASCREYFSGKKFTGRSFEFELPAGEMAAFAEE